MGCLAAYEVYGRVSDELVVEAVGVAPVLRVHAPGGRLVRRLGGCVVAATAAAGGGGAAVDAGAGACPGPLASAPLATGNESEAGLVGWAGWLV